MASYHLSVKTVQRSAGRSATAAAAYRHAARIVCDRESRVHDYRAKAGVEDSFLIIPEHAPTWAEDRAQLWNAAEARDTRVNSVTAREWELALPHELDARGRRALLENFAGELVDRYGVAADVAIHAPHREGDQRNWHAHVMTTTRALTAEGLGHKTRVLDAKATGGPEIAHMRERWAALQNDALARMGVAERVDHRTLALQRDEARALGHEARADNLDRAPEVKLGPVVSGIERREQRAAEREAREYVPLTERGAQVHEARAARSLLAELARVRDTIREEAARRLREGAEQVRERAEAARAIYSHAREEGQDRISAGLAALRAAAQRQGTDRGRTLDRDALDRALGRDRNDDGQQERQASRDSIRERLASLWERHSPERGQGAGAGASAGSIEEQLAQLRERGTSQAEERAKEGRTAEAAREMARQLGQPGSGHGLDEARERLGHLQAQENQHTHASIRERLSHALERAKPVPQERLTRGEAHEPQEEREREAPQHRQRARGHDDGWGL